MGWGTSQQPHTSLDMYPSPLVPYSARAWPSLLSHSPLHRIDSPATRWATVTLPSSKVSSSVNSLSTVAWMAAVLTGTPGSLYFVVMAVITLRSWRSAQALQQWPLQQCPQLGEF